jgi:hypothetical protein
MGERAAAVLVGAAAVVSLAGCRAEAPQGAPAAAAAAPLSRTAPPVGRLKDWTNPKRPPVTRDRNPFEFGGARRLSPDAPIAKGVSPESLPELPLPVPAADLQLIGIAGTDDGKFTAIVTVGNDLIFARADDTIASRYRVVAVGEDSLDVIDAVGDQPRHLSIHWPAIGLRLDQPLSPASPPAPTARR